MDDDSTGRHAHGINLGALYEPLEQHRETLRQPYEDRIGRSAAARQLLALGLGMAAELDEDELRDRDWRELRAWGRQAARDHLDAGGDE